MQSIKIKILIRFWTFYLSKSLEYGYILHLQQTAVLTRQCQVLSRYMWPVATLLASRGPVWEGAGVDWTSGEGSSREDDASDMWGLGKALWGKWLLGIEIGRILLIMLPKTIILIIPNIYFYLHSLRAAICPSLYWPLGVGRENTSSSKSGDLEEAQHPCKYLPGIGTIQDCTLGWAADRKTWGQ